MKLTRLILASLLVSILCLTGGYATAGAMTDYGENKTIDWLLRGQTFTPPATQYWGLTTDTCTDAGAGTEPSGNAYTRIAVTASLTNWSGTLSSAQTVASTGTSGTSYNLAAITWSASTGAWGTLQAVRLYDAASAGNSLFCIGLTSTLNVSGAGFTVQFPAASLNLQIDN